MILGSLIYQLWSGFFVICTARLILGSPSVARCHPPSLSTPTLIGPVVPTHTSPPRATLSSLVTTSSPGPANASRQFPAPASRPNTASWQTVLAGPPGFANYSRNFANYLTFRRPYHERHAILGLLGISFQHERQVSRLLLRGRGVLANVSVQLPVRLQYYSAFLSIMHGTLYICNPPLSDEDKLYRITSSTLALFSDVCDGWDNLFGCNLLYFPSVPDPSSMEH